MPPARSGVAACSADLVRGLSPAYAIDVFVDASRTPARPGTRSAHDFIWLHRQQPYDLIVYQLGNSAVHEYIWPYLFRYPGLTVLHDAHLHHARAASLLRARRAADYRAEFAASHPDRHPDLAELAVAGYDSHLYYHWPMHRLVVERSRLTAVHTPAIARELREEIPGARVEPIRLGHGAESAVDEGMRRRQRIRARYGIADDAPVLGCFGGLTPEKRIPQILAAFSALAAAAPSARLLLAGAVPDHYDLAADIARFGVAERTIITGYLDDDDDLDAHIAASDIALNLRWPTAREVSGPWLRCLAAGKPTVILGLAHLADVPAIDPRTWSSTRGFDASDAGPPVTVAVDILDEDHSLRLAMQRLARDRALRDSLGGAAQAYWRSQHSPAAMLEDYRRVIALAQSSPGPLRTSLDALPHLTGEGRRTLDEVLAAFGADPLR
jgi:glycosyltransferase involved in cell wall biosynthesis